MPPSGEDLPPLLLDACGVLNLAAALPLEGLTRSLGRPVAVVQQAADEVLYLEDVVEGRVERRLVDVSPLDVVRIDDVELGLFVSLSSVLDDGEAATLAVAHHRGWQMLTDDRKAVAVAARLDPPVSVVSTASALRAWSTYTGSGPEAVAAALGAVERRASFVPRRTDPDHDWWMRHRRA